MNSQGFHEGDRVIVFGQPMQGEILKIMGSKAMVAFENIRLTVSVSQLTKANHATAAVARPKKNCGSRIVNEDKAEWMIFNTSIDLHGMHVQEALAALDKFIDKAILLGQARLKIIHGKGTGTLRQAVKTYLQSHGNIKKISNDMPWEDYGGVTIVTLK